METCCKILSKVLSFHAEIQFLRSILLYENISGQDFCVGLVSSQTANALEQIIPGVNQHIFVHFNTPQGISRNPRPVLCLFSSWAGAQVRVHMQNAESLLLRANAI